MLDYEHFLHDWWAYEASADEVEIEMLHMEET